MRYSKLDIFLRGCTLVQRDSRYYSVVDCRVVVVYWSTEYL